MTQKWAYSLLKRCPLGGPKSVKAGRTSNGPQVGALLDNLGWLEGPQCFITEDKLKSGQQVGSLVT